MRRSLPLLAFVALALAACAEPAPIAPDVAASPATARVDASVAAADFDAAVDALSKGYFRLLPELATYSGAPDALAPGAGERLNDRSQAGSKARTAEIETLLAQLKATPAEALDADRQRLQATLVTVLDGALGPSRLVDYGSSFGAYGVWFLPYSLNQLSGPTLEVPNLLGSQHAVGDDAAARRYLARLAAFPGALDGVLAKLQHDVALGAIPPDFVIDKTRAVVDAFAATPAAEHSLVTGFRTRLDSAGVAGAADLAAQAQALVGEGVLPAYRRISAYLTEIRPQAPHDAGIWRLPEGDKLYRAMIRQMADTDLDPEAVHQTGLDEVARIGAEMDTLLRAQGYTQGSIGERMLAMGAEPRFAYPNDAAGRAAILDDIQTQLAGVRAVLPQWFGTLPKHEVNVRAVPAFSQDSAPGGYYDPPSPDGSRPGIYWINLRDTALWPSFAVATLTYHEAIPGHHMQVAIAIEQDLPLIASALYSNPSSEGWALYSEALAKEMGLYDNDPFGDLGRLQAEMHRAVRLVVDTGMHAKKWSREQAVDYMMENEGAELSYVESEIERYAVWPGQALGYKLGMLKLQALRAEAEAALGTRFDIRQFHDRLLRVSSFALPVIEQDLREWIRSEAAQPEPAAPR
jgi:uncharacterized protein (DUF885 family)